MSAEDKEWLQAAMKQYTFDDSNKMQDIVTKLDEDLKSGFTKICADGSDYGEVADLIDQLQEICEMHERCNMNLALGGGLGIVLQFILRHPDAEVRKICCSLFSAVV